MGEDKKLEDKAKEPRFNPDWSPNHPHNKEVARRLGLTYDPSLQMYVDDEGCLIRDRYGQPLG
jgi:hypothetical protein